MPASTTEPPDKARHVPVMLAEVLAALDPKDGETFIDGTFGAGGYARAILAAADTSVVAIDRDPDAVTGGYGLVSSMAGRLTLVEGRFSRLDQVANSLGRRAVDGVVLDIGVSSMQLDEAERGFSFRHDGPLDMRMERRGRSAADLVNTLSEAQLARLFWTLGEEKRASALARAIVADRARAPFQGTRDLADLCARVIRSRPGDIHPATRAFQALRIAVNRELEELAEALLAAERILRGGGRLAVVTFHSLEDRIVKTFLADRTRRQAGGSRHRPEARLPEPTFELIRKGAAAASAAEAAQNPRARSAKLRAGRRTSAPARDSGIAFLGLPDAEPADGRRG
jgi:16S rRNA (cytosine1402-N4)-methyltransferase